MKNKNGMSLLYILINMSIISTCLLGCYFFIFNKNQILTLSIKQKKHDKLHCLIEVQEKKFAEYMNMNGIDIKSDSIFLTDIADYFSTNLVQDSENNIILLSLIYQKYGNKSIGGYTIQKIVDLYGQIYHIPLKQNQFYPKLFVYLTKDGLDKKINFIQEVIFNKNIEDKFQYYVEKSYMGCEL